jgi:ribosome biogenesis GTPase A
MPYIPPWFSLDAPIRGSLSPADKLFQGQEKLSSLRKDSSIALREWLSSKHKRDIFWVTGKPGSGKSTLLKAISQHRNFGALLRTWTGGGDYVIAEHFL